MSKIEPTTYVSGQPQSQPPEGYGSPQQPPQNYGFSQEAPPNYGSTQQQPPQPGYGFQSTVAPPTTVIVQQPQPRFTKYPAKVICPFCKAEVITATSPEVGIITWVSAGIVLLFGCWLGCCFIPFCIDDLKNTRHDCPNCKRTIHLHKPM